MSINESFFNGEIYGYDSIVVKYSGPESFVEDKGKWVKIYISNGLKSYVLRGEVKFEQVGEYWYWCDGEMRPIDDYYLDYELLEIM